MERRLHAELGRPSLGIQFKSTLALAAGLWTGVTLKLSIFQHPKLTRMTYRLPGLRWSGAALWEELRRKVAGPGLSIQVELHPAGEQVCMRLEGALSTAEATHLGQRIRESLSRSKARLVLDLKKLHWNKVDDLQPFRDKLSDYRSRIRVILPKVAAAHPEVILLAGMFRHYQG